MYSLDALLRNFPLSSDPRPAQLDAFKAIVVSKAGVVLEMPTGEGKTAIGIACTNTESDVGTGPSFYVTPGKTQVGQVLETLGSKAVTIMGRSEYECLYYVNRGRPEITAQESICYSLDCPHRVSQETGEVQDPTVLPCTYFQAKWDALQVAQSGGSVVTTTAWFLMNRMLVKGWNELEPELVVIDEVHRIAGIARSIFEQRITDHHLYRAVALLAEVQPDEAAKLKAFADDMYQKARMRPSTVPSLLPESEIEELMVTLDQLKPVEISRAVREKLASGELDPVGDREAIKVLESLALSIPRMVRNLRYATSKYGTEEEKRRPLSYVIAYFFTDEEMAGSDRKASTIFELKAYYVRGLIQKAIGGAKVVAMSATIGDPKVLEFETGLKQPSLSISSSFDPRNTRIYLPTDTPDLTHAKAGRDDWKRAIQKIIEAAKRFTARGHRCLVVVTSEKERNYLIGRAARDGLTDIVTYEKNVQSPRKAAERFKNGDGMVLLGTSANYAEGVDLPGGIAPVTFMLRPGHANPDSPMSQFELRRFGKTNGRNGMFWALQNHRVAVEAQQVRGRNVRAPTDVGVTFFVTRAFQKFLRGAMPPWLESSYRGALTFDEGVTDAIKLIESRQGQNAAK